MVSSILIAILSAAWSTLFYLTVRWERERYRRLYEQAIECNKNLRKEINHNAEFKEEIRNLKTQLKERAVSKLKEAVND